MVQVLAHAPSNWVDGRSGSGGARVKEDAVAAAAGVVAAAAAAGVGAVAVAVDVDVGVGVGVDVMVEELDGRDPAWERVNPARDVDGQRLDGAEHVHERVAPGLVAQRRGQRGGTGMADIDSGQEAGGEEGLRRAGELVEEAEPSEHGDANGEEDEGDEEYENDEDVVTKRVAKRQLATRQGAGVCGREVLDPCLRTLWWTARAHGLIIRNERKR
ncbi:hypothetical protein PT974_11284 [Cladobotryum mycophilum]|uniref:Uncharacterized protein n=1 Tax=Cladobotryum mycophilum TaxID=491253 RepID=A0ABR0S5S3_9HYPO